jgi:basic membrane protein A
MLCIGTMVFAGGQQEAAQTDETIEIALVIPSTIDDMAWSQSMYKGIMAVQERMGKDVVKVDVSERLWNAVDAGSAIRQYASQGYDIVIAHGAQYQSLLDDIAPAFPEVTFAYGTGYKADHDNVFAYDPHAQEGAYLLGMAAGMLTKSNIVGIVGPVESGDAIKYNKGFEQGVKAVNPDAEVRIAYTGGFGDLVAAGEIAETHINAGADILTGSAQQTVGAIRVVAEYDGVYWMSTDMNQSSLAPDSILGAQVYNFEEVVQQMIDSRAEGVLGGTHIPLSFANGFLTLEWNDNLSSVVTPEIREAIEEAKQKIIDGEIKIEL